ncbi:MAG: hypothetical protein E4G98_03160 [Promethearchaeota archaeon]|nr:MAG: hypothetical protein E4G98_03160 [Candidatus Lokiarchaeota archaeon]
MTEVEKMKFAKMNSKYKIAFFGEIFFIIGYILAMIWIKEFLWILAYLIVFFLTSTFNHFKIFSNPDEFSEIYTFEKIGLFATSFFTLSDKYFIFSYGAFFIFYFIFDKVYEQGKDIWRHEQTHIKNPIKPWSKAWFSAHQQGIQSITYLIGAIFYFITALFIFSNNFTLENGLESRGVWFLLLSNGIFLFSYIGRLWKSKSVYVSVCLQVMLGIIVSLWMAILLVILGVAETVWVIVYNRFYGRLRQEQDNSPAGEISKQF